jgi:DNA-binding MarR family transcriptional regulator
MLLAGMGKPPPLSKAVEEAATELPLAIGQLRRRLGSAAAPTELNLSQLGTLARLHRQGPMSAAQLARAESMKPQSMGAILGSLERAGLVGRQPHSTDKRQIEFFLTAEGGEAIRQRSSAKRAWLLSAMAELAPEEQSILVSAIRLIKRLAES